MQYNCSHVFNLWKSESTLLQWYCSKCHSGPEWFMFECMYCSLKTCRACKDKAHPSSLNHSRLSPLLLQTPSNSQMTMETASPYPYGHPDFPPTSSGQSIWDWVQKNALNLLERIKPLDQTNQDDHSQESSLIQSAKSGNKRKYSGDDDAHSVQKRQLSRHKPSVPPLPIHEDKDMIVMNKPSGVPRSEEERKRASFIEAIKRYKKEGPPDCYVHTSTIKLSGRGLKALETINKGQCIGEYTGERIRLVPLIAEAEFQTHGSNELTMRDFDLCNGWGIRAPDNPCMVYYINCKQNPRHYNATFICSGNGKHKRVFVIATKDVAKGQEIFATYCDTPLKFNPTDLILPTESCIKLSRSGEVIEVGSYIFVSGESLKYWKARVTGIIVENGIPTILSVLWIYSSADLLVVGVKVEEREHEVFMTDHADDIEIKCFAGLAQIGEGKNSGSKSKWWWEVIVAVYSRVP